MAKVKNPLLSDAAHGSLGHLTFKGHAGLQVVTLKPVSIPERNRLQLQEQIRLRKALSAWRNLLPSAQDYWTQRAADGRSGVSEFVSRSLYLQGCVGSVLPMMQDDIEEFPSYVTYHWENFVELYLVYEFQEPDWVNGLYAMAYAARRPHSGAKADSHRKIYAFHDPVDINGGGPASWLPGTCLTVYLTYIDAWTGGVAGRYHFDVDPPE